MLHPVDIELICSASHSDPFSVLGPHHEEDDSLSLRVFIPGAVAVTVLDAGAVKPLGSLQQRHADGFFEATVPALAALWESSADAALVARGIDYRLQVTGADGNIAVVDDPYRFAPVLSDTDVWLLGAGSHLRPFEALGAAPISFDQVAGTRFAVWAPNSTRVSVVGDFNHWDGRRHAMRLRDGCGVWEIFAPGVAAGALYKYEIRSAAGELLPLKADPFALQCERPPATASVVAKLPPRVPGSAERRRANAIAAPISIYQVHPGSWRRHDDETRLNWDELAASLLPYVKNIGFTHLELLGVQERDDASCAAPSALYAPTARHGDVASFRRFVERCQAQGIGVILDWRPTHFSAEAQGLTSFDGTCLYERPNDHEGNRVAFDLGRTEVRNFLVGNALYWLERHGVDGLRLDVVASVFDAEADASGSVGNSETSAFLTRLNEVVHAERPQALTLAGASSALPGVARPAATGGLGFDLSYAFDERFVLSLGSAELPAGAAWLLQRMPSDHDETFASLRTYLGFVFGHPGKKRLLMGCELAQPDDRADRSSLDWALLADRRHEGVQRLCHDLNHLYAASPALFERDADAAGFDWVVKDAEHAVIAFLRRGQADTALMLVVCNFSATALPAYRIGVPSAGWYRQCLDTDSAHYAGAGLGTGFAVAPAETLPWHGRPYSLALTLPPLTTVMIEWKS